MKFAPTGGPFQCPCWGRGSREPNVDNCLRDDGEAAKDGRAFVGGDVARYGCCSVQGPRRLCGGCICCAFGEHEDEGFDEDKGGGFAFPDGWEQRVCALSGGWKCMYYQTTYGRVRVFVVPPAEM